MISTPLFFVCLHCFSHSNELTEESLKNSAKIILDANKNYSGKINSGPKKTNKYLYTDVNPIEAKNFSEKIDLLNKIDKYLRSKNPYVKQVSSSIFSEYQQIEIIRPDNQSYSDKRPLVRFNVSIMVEKNGRKETGSYGTGGRKILDVNNIKEAKTNEITFFNNLNYEKDAKYCKASVCIVSENIIKYLLL